MNTNYFLNLIAGNVFGTQKSPEIPQKYYLALSTTDPASSVTEPASGNYARIELTGLSTPENGVVKNSSELRSNRATDSWGVLTHYAIYDAPSGGNLLMYNPLSRSRTVDTDTIIIFEAGDIELKVQNPA